MELVDFGKYLKQDSPFFEEPFSGKQHYFEPSLVVKEHRASFHRNEVWTQCEFGKSMPEQGWKIHVGSTVLNCGVVLNIVGRICSQRQTAFKFLKSKEVFLSQHVKYANRCQAGKFITIYPQSDDDFLDLLHILCERLHNIPSPPILTDVNVPETPVFFRYGGFQALQTLDNEGKHVPAIRNDKGELIPDIRSTQFSMPDFVVPPAPIVQLIKDCMHPTDNLLSELIKGYEVENALHFSNAGGIYQLKSKDSGRAAVMKEGRGLQGIDGSGSDGRDRINHEYAVLEALQEVKGVVKPIKLSPAGDNAYLFEEYISGQSLFDWLARQYPFTATNSTVEYEEQAIRIIEELRRVVDAVHKAGICLRDIQPRNIMLGDDLTVTLIDMESSVESENPEKMPIGTPGFMPHVDCTPTESDSYSLMQVAMQLFVPIVSAQGLTDDYWSTELEFVSRNFSKNATDLLTSLRKSISPSLLKQSEVVTPSTIAYPVYDHIEMLRSRLIGGLHSSRRNDHPNYHGDVEQYENEQAQFDIEYGLAGVMFALGPSDENAGADLATLKKAALDCDFQDYGLYRGSLGVACVLAERGETDATDQLIDRFLEHDRSQDNISLRSGLAGQYLALRKIRQFDHSDVVQKAYDQVLAALSTYDKEQLQSTKLYGIANENGSGLLDGYSGIAIALHLAAADTNNKTLETQARDALNLELDDLVISEDGIAMVPDRSRLLPYLAEGSGGVALAIKVLDPRLTQKRNADFLKKIVKSCGSRLCVQSGIFYGYAGLLGIDMQCGFQTENTKQRFDNLALYLFDDKHGNQLITGNGGQAMSCDYSTGAAGLLALLNYLTGNADTWVFGLPPIESTIKNSE